MNSIFLTSDIGAYKKINGEKIPCPLNNSNNLLTQLKEDILSYDNFLFIANDPQDFEKNDGYANSVFACFKLSGLKFKNFILLDNRNVNNSKSLIENADVIYLAGGKIQEQLDFFESINLKELLQQSNAVVIGQSAGSMNLGKAVYSYPEEIEEIDQKLWFKGLGLTNLTIIPHFDENTGNVNTAEEIDLLNDYLLKDSKKETFYCIKNFSHIRIKNNTTTFHGDCFKISNGIISAINQENKLEK